MSTLDKDNEKKENKVWTEFVNPDKRLGCVEVVCTGTRDFFFATEDNNSYLNHLKVDYDGRDVKCQVVCSFSSEKIMAL